MEDGEHYETAESMVEKQCGEGSRGDFSNRNYRWNSSDVRIPYSRNCNLWDSDDNRNASGVRRYGI